MCYLTAAAGFWGPESVPEEISWTEVPGVSLKPGMFVARVTGSSMEQLIPNGSWCLFRPCPAGSREGRIVLVHLGTDGAGENGGRFTVKRYDSEKTITDDGWRHARIQLLPANLAFGPIQIDAEEAEAAAIMVASEFLLKFCRSPDGEFQFLHPPFVLRGFAIQQFVCAAPLAWCNACGFSEYAANARHPLTHGQLSLCYTCVHSPLAC